MRELAGPPRELAGSPVRELAGLPADYCGGLDVGLPVPELAGLTGNIGVHRHPKVQDLPVVLLLGMLEEGNWGVRQKNLRTV